MPTVTALQTGDELSRQDAEQLSRDVRRILRRARYWIRQDHAIKRARPLIHRSAENLAELLRMEGTVGPISLDFETAWEKLGHDRKRALEAVNPFVGFFRSHGLLPDEVTEDALLIHVLMEGARRGLYSFD